MDDYEEPCGLCSDTGFEVVYPLLDRLSHTWFMMDSALVRLPSGTFWYRCQVQRMAVEPFVSFLSISYSMYRIHSLRESNNGGFKHCQNSDLRRTNAADL